MRILLLQETNWIERGPHQQHHLMDRMSLRGHKIRVIDYNLLWRENGDRRIIKRREDLGNQPKVFSDAEVKLIRPAVLQIPTMDYLSIPITHTLEIKRQIRDFKPDVILSFGILNAYIGARLARRHGIPYVYYLIDHLHTLVPLTIARPFARYIESQTIKMSDLVLVINKGLKDYVVEMGGEIEKVRIVPGGVDFDRFRVDSQTRKRVRSAYGIKENEVVLFFMGWLYSFSGLKEVATELMNGDYVNIRLMIVGEGDLYDDLKKIKGDSDKIILTGKQPYDRIPELLSAADICLLPAYNIPTMQNIVPIKMYEYMAMGKPVIATKLPGIMKEFDIENGILYVDKPENVLKKVMESLDAGLIEMEGEKAKNFAKSYDWIKIVDDFERVLEELTHIGGIE